MDNYILAYYQQIRDGSVVVGKWISLIYEKIVHGIESGEYVFDAKKANAAIDWIEQHCFHCEGDLAPNPLKLELWQKALVSCIFGILDPKTNKRQFREILLIIARKQGKSLLAAAIGKYIWTLEGGFGARVYCLAPKLDQADLIYNDIWTMTQLDPDWKARKEKSEEKDANGKKHEDATLERHRMTDLYIPASNAMVKKIAFSAKKSDGFNPSLTVCDEIASWEGDKGLKQYEVMKSGMGARAEGLLFSCSTAGYINGSIYDELYTRATRFLKGDSGEKRLLPFIYQVDDPSKWNDLNELRKSSPNLGVSISYDYYLDEIAVAEGSLSKKAEFLTKYANIKQNSAQAWLDAQVVERSFGDALHLEDFRESYAVAGIDLSRTTDLTACVLAIEKNGKTNVFCRFYLPAEKIEEATARDGMPYRQYIERGFLFPSGDNFIDYHDVFRWLTELVERYQIYPLCVGYDRYSSQYLVQDLKNYGFKTDDVFQGENLTPVIREFEGTLKDGCFNFGDNQLLKAHLLDSALKMNAETDRVKLVKVNRNVHIDGTAALLDALCVKQKWHTEIGQQLKNE